MKAIPVVAAATRKLLVVEDDVGLQRQLKWSYDDYEVLVAGDREAALDAVAAHAPAVVTLDLGLPPDPDGTSEGFATLDAILKLKPATKIIVASGHGARDSAVRAIAAGAFDFYSKPVEIDELGMIVRRAYHVSDLEAENRRLTSLASTSDVLGGLITAAPEMLKVARLIERVAASDASIMLLGASGTGKELLARGLHNASLRAAKPFVAINCAAIPENLLEAELFGYEKGAYTGAVKTTEGKIELAQSGTLFLDEVGDIPLPLQVKLLRFLQERVIERIGGRRAIPVDVRIVCATHQDLETMITQQRFREDLYYRLAAITVHVPALRERPEDLPAIARALLLREASTKDHRLDVPALAILSEHAWPGNVRELANVLRVAATMVEGKVIGRRELAAAIGSSVSARGAGSGSVKPVVKETTLAGLRARHKAELRELVGRAVAGSDGNKKLAARSLGVSRQAMYRVLGS